MAALKGYVSGGGVIDVDHFGGGRWFPRLSGKGDIPYEEATETVKALILA